MKVSIPTVHKKEEITKNEMFEKPRKIYDYFSIRIPRSQIESKLKLVKDERFLFFIKYGTLRRYDGDCEVIYVEIPQIPKKLVIYRRPCARMKSVDKFNLSKKDLPHIPLFEGEENLQYLSLEINQITKIDQLISLNNLVYLNLYCNRISEIENLQNTTKLKVLLLGKNCIDKIKNLHYLHELEILDLHSNRIKQVENLSQLKKLRILNLANNQINSITELLYNRNLEELNIRKNVISVIPNLSGNWEKMKKLNMGKNQLSKVDSLIELKKLKNLIELIVEENPVLLLKESAAYVQSLPIFVFSSYPMKTPYNNNNNSNSIMINPTSNNNLYKSQTLQTSKRQSINGGSTTSSTNSSSLRISAMKNPFHSNNQHQNQMNDTSDIQSVNIIKPIKLRWEDEIKRIRLLGFNGYNNKRYKEHNLTHGHVELDGDDKLILYGDAVKILSHEEFHSRISSLCFYYYYYDFIMSKSNIELMKKYKKLTSISFNDNNLFSFYQLIKLENLVLLEHISIYNNEVNNSVLLKYFLIYRIQNLKSFNGVAINESDIAYAKVLFEYFDRCISCNEKVRESEKENSDKGKDDLGSSRQCIVCKNRDRSEINEKFFEFVKENLSTAVKEIIDDMNNQEI
jgi:Leucine-rich repeat (LRR) protein